MSEQKAPEQVLSEWDRHFTIEMLKIPSGVLSTPTIAFDLAEALRQAIRERDALRAKLKIAMEALASIADCPHAGQGFCYEPHGTRKCSCHVADAREALAKIKA